MQYDLGRGHTLYRAFVASRFEVSGQSHFPPDRLYPPFIDIQVRNTNPIKITFENKDLGKAEERGLYRKKWRP
ncbi:hypothetical protein [Pararhizobium sp. PWRC1-1]|uniref:hypothetical protein n=1 Tax=Pararhizobium sp. PWRC1-1 TaxID=2804566 RepID=UPI003CE80058